MIRKNKKQRMPKRRRSTGEMSSFLPLFFIGLIAVALFSVEIAILIAAGMVPTLVLALTGKGENKNAKLQCVSFTNLSGIMFMVPGVWNRPSSVYETLAEPINLLVMWGSAAVGYALIYIGPQIAAMILQGLSQDRLKQIAAQKQALVDQWGPDVLGDKEEENAPGAALRSNLAGGAGGPILPR